MPAAPHARHVYLEVCDIGPDALPLVFLEEIQAGDNVCSRSERSYVMGEDGTCACVVNAGATVAEYGEPFADGRDRVLLCDGCVWMWHVMAGLGPCSVAEGAPKCDTIACLGVMMLF